MKLPRLNISAPALLLWALAVYLSPPGALVPLVLPVLIHELGHISAMLALGRRLTGLSLEAGGLVIAYRGESTPWQEALIAAAGPAAGLLAAAPLSAFGEKGSMAAGVSVLLSLFNLIPSRPLDGGRLARLLAGRLSEPVELICRGVLLSLGLWLYIRGMGAGLLAAGIFICFAGDTGNSARTVL